MKRSALHALTLMIATTMMLPASANAQVSSVADSNRYLFIGGALTAPRDSSVNYSGTAPFTYDLGFDYGLAWLAAAGVAVSDDLAVEVEFGYRSLDFDEAKNISSLPGLTDPTIGDISTSSLMINGIYSIKSLNLDPYIGAGLGVARHKAEYPQQFLGPSDTPLPALVATDNALAYQLMFGIRMPVSDGVSLRAGYRYFGTGKVKTPETVSTYGVHNFESGLIFHF